MSFIKSSGRNFHYFVSGLLLIILAPLLKINDLPFRYNLKSFIFSYFYFAAQAIFLSVFLYFLTDPIQLSRTLIKSCGSNRIRIFLILVFFTVLLWATSAIRAAILTLDTFAFIEFVGKARKNTSRANILAITLPILYLLGGLIIVSSYNVIILSARSNVNYDLAFSTMDKWLLNGGSVSIACHYAARTFSIRFFRGIEIIYYGLFPLIGAGLIFSSVGYGWRRGMKYVGVILTSYYIALGTFYLWPSLGPYFLCSNHFSLLPHQLQTYALQKQSIQQAQALWNHAPLKTIAPAYYIAFPCMHIAQSLAVLWFLRAWKNLRLLLIAYSLLLIGAIVLLEWHYLVDIIAGIAVIAIALTFAEGASTVAQKATKSETKDLCSSLSRCK